MSRYPTPGAWADRQEEIETPEHVAISYELADLGSRFAALLLDGLIIAGGLLTLFVGIPLLVRRIGGLPDVVAGLGFALIVIVAFTLVWGYFVYFEGLRDGQTPGKRALRIRAVHDGGYPLTLRGAAVRNLLRVIDIQPFPSWLVGGTTMMLHPRTKRLGDLAAGTVVVRERTAPRLPEEAAATTVVGAPILARAELEALARYIARRDDLKLEVAQRIAGQLAARLEPRLAGDERRHRLPAEAYLAILYAEETARHAAVRGGGPAGGAQAAALVRRQRGVWEAYRTIVERAQRQGLERMPEADVSRFAALYREVSADLARARTYGGSAELVYSLERWVGAGHNLLYRPAGRSWRLVRDWLTRGFPTLVRLRWRPLALAAAAFYVPALLAFAAVHEEPGRAREMLPAGMIARAEEAPLREAEGAGYIEVPEVVMPVMASGIIANNVQVTFMAFAGGLAAGLGTLLILVFNGVHLGAVAALFESHGASLQLWSFVLPHGIIELTAICIAGGAGIWLGSALVVPGRRTRRETLVIRGREAVSLLAGTAMLLGIAGMIEGFISPAEIPRAIKILFATVFAALLAAYLLLAGRGEPDAAPADRR